jgi:hypothetical protein
MILHITYAEHLQGYQLWLKFNDGSEGIVDLAHELWGNRFEPLKNPVLFGKVRFDKELSTVVWPNGADLAPEFLYELWQKQNVVQMK